ncbi:TPA: type II secretion system protein [Pseudomonas aeruginosa]|uniref:type II secretion system protein n=1 Tax=Pseudomonas aeruginosa TaxID=287 RepID=UPI001F2A5F75|nr:type II secretion system protein [Pseudomonas aeruginosa]
MKKRRANSQASMGGFTLIELAIVLAVMAMIAVYATPRYMEQLNQKRAILTAQETQSFLDAARSYRMQNGSWPGQASSCANAKSVLESTSPPTLAGISATNKYNQAVTPACNANTFSITQSIAQDWDGVVANNLPGTIISNAATYTIRSTIGIPGSEPALNSKLSRVYTGDPEMNRMRTPLLLGGNSINEVSNMYLNNGGADARVRTDAGRLILSTPYGGEVAIENGTNLSVENVTLRQRGNANLIDLLPNFVQKGTYLVRHSDGVIKPACPGGGSARASLRPGTMRGGWQEGEVNHGAFGYEYRLLDYGSYWIVSTNIIGSEVERNNLQSLVDVYCYYP